MKFQVGDEVRVVNTPPGMLTPRMLRENYVGQIHEVTRVDDGMMPYELSNSFWCREEDIELVVDHDVLMQKVLERNNKPETLKELTEPLDLIASHKRICEHLNNVYADKNHDYGNSFGETYEKYGDISALVRISDKMNRIDQLVQTGEQKVKDEALEDSILDMANYLIMWAMELEEGRMRLNTIYNEDCLEGMKRIPDGGTNSND